jgi:hypothetical protein
MPRYFFHLHNDVDAPDEEGTELRDAGAARDFAIEAARDLVCADIHKGHLNLDHRIEVKDAEGAHVLTVTFREAFTIEG